MLRNVVDLSIPFSGPSFPGAIRLDSGPAAMAAAARKAIDGAKLSELLAEGTPEKMLSDWPRYPAPWLNMHLAECAVYLAGYDEARELLLNAIKFADINVGQYYGDLSVEARRYLTILGANPDALRKEFLEIIGYNWSHFQVVDQ
jgi:hypothetical protein